MARLHPVFLLGIAALLAACGSGGDAAPGDTPPVTQTIRYTVPQAAEVIDRAQSSWTFPSMWRAGLTKIVPL